MSDVFSSLLAVFLVAFFVRGLKHGLQKNYNLHAYVLVILEASKAILA